MDETAGRTVTERAEVRMANQIAANFRHHPEEQATAEVAGHLRSFWTPRMLGQLRAMVEDGAVDVDPLVRRAVELLRPSEPSPTGRP